MVERVPETRVLGAPVEKFGALYFEKSTNKAKNDEKP